jgi:D-glycero-alpha-D-manno-heptose-7-phosphate kinase
VSLAGGGTDLREFYEIDEGRTISFAIDKYVFVIVSERFDDRIYINYTKKEIVDSVDEVKHELVREAMRITGVTSGVEVTMLADIPSEGSGLGSSSSLTVGLLNALYMFRGRQVGAAQLADEACRIEIELCGKPIGKQDQYIAAYGGITCFQFSPDGRVDAWPLKLDTETLYNLEDNLLLFFTGYSRTASSLLKEQDDRSKQGDRDMLENLHYVKDLGQESKDALEAGNLRHFAGLMNRHWEWKRQRSGAMSNPEIDACYDLARQNGALGGKLIGAGGGGFLLFYADDKTRLRHAMAQTSMREVRFRFDFEGTKLVIH